MLRKRCRGCQPLLNFSSLVVQEINVLVFYKSKWFQKLILLQRIPFESLHPVWMFLFAHSLPSRQQLQTGWVQAAPPRLPATAEVPSPGVQGWGEHCLWEGGLHQVPERGEGNKLGQHSHILWIPKRGIFKTFYWLKWQWATKFHDLGIILGCKIVFELQHLSQLIIGRTFVCLDRETKLEFTQRKPRY